MKKNFETRINMRVPELTNAVFCVFIFAALVFGSTGCTQLENALLDPQEIIKETIVTGSDGREITTYETNVVWKVNPKIDAGLMAAKGINDIANPTPTSPLISLIISLLGTNGILGLYARRKNKEGAKVKELFQTTVKGIEEFGSPEIKSAVRKVSEIIGNAEELHAAVKQITQKKKV